MKDSVEHIFFDLDHTLWDFDRNSTFAFERIFKNRNLKIDTSEFLEIYQPINLKFWKLYREEKVTKQQLRRRRFKEAFLELNYDFNLETIDAMATEYIDYLPLNNYLIQGAQELLDYLNPYYHLHIITNGFTEVQQRKLENSGIGTFFNTITDSEEVGVKKPNPIIFEHAVEKANAGIEQSLMIGDNYEADILGAHAIGMKTICFNYHKENIPENFIQVSDLNDIKSYL